MIVKTLLTYHGKTKFREIDFIITGKLEGKMKHTAKEKKNI